MRTQEYQESGWSETDAALRARRDFGNVLAQQERTGDFDMFIGLEGWLRDVQVAARRLRRSPIFLSTSVILLAVGIGLNAAVFGVLDVLFLKPLPFPAQEQLVVLAETNEGKPANSNPIRIRDWQARVPGLAGVASYYGETPVLARRDGNERVLALRTVGDLFGVLRVPALAGRLYSAEAKDANLAVLTERGRRLGKVGDTLRIGGQALEVVGVVGNEIGLGEEVDLLAPAPAGVGANRKAGFLLPLARMTSGTSLPVLQQQLNAAAAGMAKDFPDTDAQRGVIGKSMLAAITAEARDMATKVQAAAALLLLICVLNLAGLFAARTVERERESAVRRSLGAGAWQVLRLHVVEAGIVVLLGCAGAALAARWTLDLIQQQYGDNLTLLRQARLDARTFLFLAAVAIACVLLFAAVMALQSLRERRVAGERSIRLRGGLLVLEAALGVLMLGVSFEVAQDFAQLSGKTLGVKEQGVVYLKVDLPWDLSGEQTLTATRQGLVAVSTLPGVASAGLVDRLPLEGGTQSGPAYLNGDASKLPDEIGFRMASPGAHDVLGVPLLAGEPLGAKGAVLVNEAFSRKYLGGAGVGKLVSRDGKSWLRIAGIIGNIRVAAQDPAPRPEVYALPEELLWPKLVFVLKTAESPLAIERQAKKEWARISPVASVAGAGRLEERIANSFAEPRRRRDAAGLLGLVALLLVVSGVYGLMAGEVVRRTREMGIRLAIGANEWEVFGLVMRRALGMGLFAVVLGGAAGLAIAGPSSALSLGASALLVLAAMLAAAAQPAVRLMRVQPAVALRSE